ncbi:MAG TPA: hypothetical protein GX714_14605 [Chloroflexi bacterium]|jgi:uncharacterized spore protein YtfJ|nr:hypothetical protein [Chloroflexota bacterium]
MSEAMGRVTESAERTHERVVGLVERLTEVTRPGAVFGEPMSAGENTVVTASEVFLAMGYGFGIGGGAGMQGMHKEGDEGAGEAAVHGGEMPSGYGGGGGGGGTSKGRPVAVITINPAGVRIEPVLDLTKIGLAFLMVLGSLFLTMGKMRRGM